MRSLQQPLKRNLHSSQFSNIEVRCWIQLQAQLHSLPLLLRGVTLCYSLITFLISQVDFSPPRGFPNKTVCIPCLHYTSNMPSPSKLRGFHYSFIHIILFSNAFNLASSIKEWLRYTLVYRTTGKLKTAGLYIWICKVIGVIKAFWEFNLLLISSGTLFLLLSSVCWDSNSETFTADV